MIREELNMERSAERTKPLNGTSSESQQKSLIGYTIDWNTSEKSATNRMEENVSSYYILSFL